MALGMRPARGTWEKRWFPVDSAATFPAGSLVNLGADFEVEEYASTDSQALGISATSSTASRSIGGVASVCVYIPLPGATAWSDLTTGVTAAGMPIGKAVCIYKQGNFMSYASTVAGHGSNFSALVTVASLPRSDTSQVEVAFNIDRSVLYSSSTHTFAS